MYEIFANHGLHDKVRLNRDAFLRKSQTYSIWHGICTIPNAKKLHLTYKVKSF